MNCPYCKEAIPNNSTICPYCAKSLGFFAAEMAVNEIADNKHSQTKSCPKCHSDIPADSRYCPECQAAQHDPEALPNRDCQSTGIHRADPSGLTPTEYISMKKRNKIIAIIYCAAFLVAIISLFIRPKVNLDPYLIISVDGYDTFGKASVSFDEERFIQDYGELFDRIADRKARADETLLDKLFGEHENRSGREAAKFLSRYVTGSLDRTRRLSNGDIVTYDWECNDEAVLEEYGVELQYDSVDYSVVGLQAAETFDAFSGFEVWFTGADPEGEAHLIGYSYEDPADRLLFELDRYYDLSNGDTVNLNFNVDMHYYGEDAAEYYAENYGKVPEALSKTFIVEGLDKFATAISDIPDSWHNELRSIASYNFYDRFSSGSIGDEELLGLNYCGEYLLVHKNPETRGEAYFNILYLVYKATVRNTYSQGDENFDRTTEYYWYVGVPDVIVGSGDMEMPDEYEYPQEWIVVDSYISMPSDPWETIHWLYFGYESLNELFNNCVAWRTDDYDYQQSFVSE